MNEDELLERRRALDEGNKRQSQESSVSLLVTVTRLEGKVEHLVDKLALLTLTFADDIKNINTALTDMAKTDASKHQENIQRIEINHKENQAILATQTAALLEHKADDQKNFAALFKLQDRIWFGFKVIAVVWTILCVLVAGAWGFFSALPTVIRILSNAKGLGD